MKKNKNRRKHQKQRPAPEQSLTNNIGNRDPLDLEQLASCPFPFRSKTTPSAAYPETKEQFKALQDLRNRHFTDFLKLTKADNGKIYLQDHYLYGVLQRSLDLLNGFSVMVLDWNFNAAAPIARQQIDTLVRLHYVARSGQGDEVTLALMDGKSFRNLKDKEGKKLTDARLQELCASDYPWISQSYGPLCGVTHFSGTHLFLPVTNVRAGESIVSIGLTHGTPQWNKEDLIRLLGLFRIATLQILYCVEKYIDYKEGKSSSDKS